MSGHRLTNFSVRWDNLQSQTKTTHPVLVLGAGINGVAIARELLLNGIPVWLIDQADIASGATAYSSRLVHGGLRYLEYREFDLVRESLLERSRLLRLAPQYVRLLRLFIPTETRFGGLWRALLQYWGWSPRRPVRSVPRGAWLVRMALWLYDKHANDSNIPQRAHHTVTDGDVPRVNSRRFRWLASYYDAQVQYPERLVLAFLEDAQRAACRQGIEFRIWTYHQVRLKDRRVGLFPMTSASLRQQSGVQGQKQAVKAVAIAQPAAIVNATGAWVDRALRQLPVDSSRLIGGTRGSHLVCRHPVLRKHLHHGGIYAEANDGRPVFLLPFGELVLIGTTDIPFEGNPRHAVASDEELDYLIASANDILDDLVLTRDDVIAHYCGVRPLPFVDHGSPGSITRRHRLEEHDTGDLPVYSVIGGKLTTCRSLAETVAERILQRLGREATVRSHNRTVAGGEGLPQTKYAEAAMIGQIADSYRLTREQVRPIWEWFGTRADAVLAQCMSDRSYGSGYIQLANIQIPVPLVRWIIRHEWVRTLSDLVERRLMLVYDPDLTEDCLRQLAGLLHDEHILSEDFVEPSVQSCLQQLENRYGRKVGPAADSEHGTSHRRGRSPD